MACPGKNEFVLIVTDACMLFVQTGDWDVDKNIEKVAAKRNAIPMMIARLKGMDSMTFALV